MKRFAQSMIAFAFTGVAIAGAQMIASCTDGATPDCSTIDSGCFAFDAGFDSGEVTDSATTVDAPEDSAAIDAPAE